MRLKEFLDEYNISLDDKDIDCIICIFEEINENIKKYRKSIKIATLYEIDVSEETLIELFEHVEKYKKLYCFI
jgi:tRNA G10  N-methylase Trm11